MLIKPDSTATFTVGKTGTLKGVYNYNKGYADFKQIEVLYDNEEYSIVKSKTRYGLRVYDYIILDAESYDKNLSQNIDDSQATIDESADGGSTTDS